MSTTNPMAEKLDAACCEHRKVEDDDSDLEVVGRNQAPIDHDLQNLEAPEDSLPKQFYLLTHPRSASNLLVQILNLPSQHHIVTGNHEGGYYFKPFIRAMVDLDILCKQINAWSPEDRAKIRASADECYAVLEKDIAKVNVEPGKTSIFVKEHCDFLWSPFGHTRSSPLSSWAPVMETEKPFSSCDGEKLEPWILGGGVKTEGNGTFLSDEFLVQWMPTFLVRHPALAFPSVIRASKDLWWSDQNNADDDEKLALHCSLYSSRKLYDFFDAKLPQKLKQYGGVDWPVILTGDAVITEPEVIKRYASLVRLDVDKLQFTWKPRPKEVVEVMGKNNARMMSTLISSAGIDKSKASKAVDIDAEVLKWRKEFGDHAAESLEGWVRAAMPDYEFFNARRLRAQPTVIDGRRV